MFLYLGKHGQKCFYRKHPRQNIVDINFTDLWKLVLDTSYREPKVIIQLRRKQKKTEGLEQFFGASRGSDFGEKEESIGLDVLIFIMRNEDIRKQLCMETLTPADASHTAVVREREDMLYKQLIRGLQKSSRSRLNQGRQNSTNNQQTGYIKREPVKESKGQRGDECHNFETWLKPNRRKNSPAQNFIYDNCGGRVHFAKHCKKARVIHVNGANDFTQKRNT